VAAVFTETLRNLSYFYRIAVIFVSGMLHRFWVDIHNT